MAAPASARVAIRSLSAPAFTQVRMSVGLLLIDVCSLTVSALAAFRLWIIINPYIPHLHTAMLAMPLSTIMAFLFAGLYPGIGLTMAAHIRKLWKCITLTYLLLTASMFLVKDWWVDSRGVFFISWLLSLLLVPAGRWLCEEVLDSYSWWGIPVMIIGAGQTARAVIHALRSHRILGFRPVACVDDDINKHGLLEGVPVSGSLNDIVPLANWHKATYAIVAIPSMPREKLIQHLQHWSRVFPRILLIPNLIGVSSLWTESRDLGGVLGLEMEQKLLDPLNRMTKRCLDIIAASFGLLITWPILLISALLIRKVSPGNPFYVQLREGQNGREIGVLKLRTMYLDADWTLRQHLEENPAAQLEWDRFCKLKQDPRILPGVGGFLRKTSLDELPQLWNVLKGEMSLVGPRPFPAYHNQLFNPDVRSIRMQVPPGITGLWQVTARSNGDLTMQASLDEYYIRNWSLWLDLYVLIRTVKVVLTQEGSY